MKKTILFTALCLGFAASPAFAQASSFAGLGAGLRLNVAETSTENVVGGLSRKASDTDNNFALQLQYNMALGNAFVLGLGGTIDFGDLKAGKFGANQFKTKDVYSLYVAPGYAFNNTWMAYGKLAYLNAKLESGAGNSVRFDDGYSYGVGLQVMYTKNWYGQAELMINQYNDRSPALGQTLKLKSGVYSLTAGYRF